MKFLDLIDKKISIVVWNTDKKNDVHVYLAKLQMENDECYLLNEEKGWKVFLDEDRLSRLKSVSSDLRDMLLNADYTLNMSLSELPQSNSDEYKATGMKWHK